MLDHNIALWDALKACERAVSAGSAIFFEESNDFETFFSNHPNVKLIIFNGQNAEAYLKNIVSLNLTFLLLLYRQPVRQIPEKVLMRSF